MEIVSKILAQLKANGEKYAGSIVDEQDLADLVAQEISAMDAAIEEVRNVFEEHQMILFRRPSQTSLLKD